MTLHVRFQSEMEYSKVDERNRVIIPRNFAKKLDVSHGDYLCFTVMQICKKEIASPSHLLEGTVSSNETYLDVICVFKAKKPKVGA